MARKHTTNTLNRVRMTLLVGGLFAAWSQQDVRALTTNLAPVADTTLRSGALEEGLNFGADAEVKLGVGNAGSPVNRGLFKFDFTGIPANATITDVTLNLKVTGASFVSPPASFELHRLLNDWSESQATWLSRLTATSWGAGGGLAGTDFDGAASATGTLGNVGASATFSSATLASEVQVWLVTPASNLGWLLKATGEPSGTGKRVGSRESIGSVPFLTVGYTVPEPPTPPAPPTQFGIALDGNQIRFSFNAESNRTYNVQFRDSFNSGDWSSLTNVPALPAATTVNVTNAASGSEGYFRVRTP